MPYQLSILFHWLASWKFSQSIQVIVGAKLTNCKIVPSFVDKLLRWQLTVTSNRRRDSGSIWWEIYRPTLANGKDCASRSTLLNTRYEWSFFLASIFSAQNFSYGKGRSTTPTSSLLLAAWFLGFGSSRCLTVTQNIVDNLTKGLSLEIIDHHANISVDLRVADLSIANKLTNQ